ENAQAKEEDGGKDAGLRRHVSGSSSRGRSQCEHDRGGYHPEACHDEPENSQQMEMRGDARANRDGTSYIGDAAAAAWARQLILAQRRSTMVAVHRFAPRDSVRGGRLQSFKVSQVSKLPAL